MPCEDRRIQPAENRLTQRRPAAREDDRSLSRELHDTECGRGPAHPNSPLLQRDAAPQHISEGHEEQQDEKHLGDTIR